MDSQVLSYSEILKNLEEETRPQHQPQLQPQPQPQPIAPPPAAPPGRPETPGPPIPPVYIAQTPDQYSFQQQVPQQQNAVGFSQQVPYTNNMLFPGLGLVGGGGESTKGTNVDDGTGTGTRLNDFHTEMITLLMVYIVIHMTSVQGWISTKIPNFRTDIGSLSVLGLVTNGVLLLVAWNVVKRYGKRFN
eukprot:693256-Prorocentrum_minimum.AAC.33